MTTPRSKATASDEFWSFSVPGMSQRFPVGFVWGAATASYQIEGAVDEGGRGESIWDRFSHTDGSTFKGHTGDVACDHYHRWPEDLDLLSRLGAKAYRFSIAWPRIMPEGRGEVNKDGLDFYSRLVDGLLETGIVPFATLYHWDLPQALEDEGGWTARSTAHAFVAYAEAVVSRLGDRVTKWMTLNEPWCSAVLGYMTGDHAPGRVDVPAALDASHHLLLAHGLATPIIQAAGGEAGIVLNQDWCQPASAHPADQAAADMADQKMSLWFLDPVTGRGYPEGAVRDHGWDQSVVRPGDLDTISAPIDHFGLNYYTRQISRASDLSDEERSDVIKADGEPTDMGWEVHPQGLSKLLLRLHDEYKVGPIYITENGAAYPDAADASGFVDDQDRIEFLERHLRAVGDAMAGGVPVAGYFVWSLLDNFEWALGYSKRFGLVRVDYDTLKRTPKASFDWYRDVIERNRP